MGLGGISVWQLLIVLLIVVLLFGTKRLRSIGNDLGDAVRGFRKAVDDGEQEQAHQQLSESTESDTPAASAESQEAGNNDKHD
jgi:sec-independent protein translocase protein TatA